MSQKSTGKQTNRLLNGQILSGNEIITSKDPQGSMTYIGTIKSIIYFIYSWYYKVKSIIGPVYSAPSLASHTLQSQEKEGLVTMRTASCSVGMQ